MKKKITLETAPEYLTVQQLVDLGIYSSVGAAHCAFSRGKGPKRMRLDDRKILYSKADVYSYLDGLNDLERYSSPLNNNKKQEEVTKTTAILERVEEEAKLKAQQELEEQLKDHIWPYAISTKWKPLVPIFSLYNNTSGESTGSCMPIRGVQGVGRCAFRYNGHTMNFNIKAMWFWGEEHRVDDQFRLAATLLREKGSGSIDVCCWMVHERIIQVLINYDDCPVGFKAFILSAMSIKEQFVYEYNDKTGFPSLSSEQDVSLDMNIKAEGRPIWRKEEIVSYY